MDFKVETASHLPNSSGSPSSSSSSNDSAIHNSINNNNSNNNDNDNSSGSSDGGFVSGEEEFVMEADKEKAADDVAASTFLDPTEFPPLNREYLVPKVYAKREQPVSKAPFNDNDDKFAVEEDNESNGIEVVGDSGKEVLVRVGEGETQKERSVLGETGSEVGGSEGVGESNILSGGNEEEDTGTLKLEGGGLDGTRGVEFTSVGDSVLEAVNFALLKSGVAAVGDVEGSKEYSEVEGVEVPVENGFDKISTGVEEDVNVNMNMNIDSERDVEVVTGLKTEVAEVECHGTEINVCTVGKGKHTDISSGVDDAILERSQDTTKLSVEKAENVGATNTHEKLEKEVESETNEGSKQIELEPAVKTATEGLDVLANHQVDEGDINGTVETGSIAETAPTLVPHDRQQYLSAVNRKLDDAVSGGSDLPESAESIVVANVEDAEHEEKNHPGGEGEDDESVTDGEAEGMIFGSSDAAAKQFLEELERGSGVGSHSGAESSHDYSQRIDGQIVTDSDEGVDTDEEDEGKELFDSATLAALLKAATGAGSEGGTVTMTSQDGSRLFSVERPAGLGTSLRPVKPAAPPNRPNLFSSNLTTGEGLDKGLTEEEQKKQEKVQEIRVKFLRLLHRLGQSPDESMAAQVLYRLALVAGKQTSQLFNLDSAKRTALQLEAEGSDDLDFSLNILVLGKTGVGKSATINSIFDDEKSPIHAFEPATNSVCERTGIVDGVEIRVIDSPGLKSSGSEQGSNCRVLTSIKKFMKRSPPDIVLYVDRLDTQTRDLNDLPLLTSITSSLGSSIWRNAVVTLTHGASSPPDGPSGSPLSYEVFVAQCSRVVQQSIGQAIGDLRLMNPSLMNPVSIVENHPSCHRNRDGQKVLPNGQRWRTQLLLLCYSLKILSEASSLSKPQDPFDHRKLFGFRPRSPPLPYLLSWLLQSRTHPKLSTDQGGDVDSDIDLADLFDSDQEEEEDEYDQLPPFKPLRKMQLARLSKEQKKAYFEEYDYRVKLLQKKQWREELRRMREIEKKGKVAADEYAYSGEDVDPENETPAAVPVPLPDMVLPPSFDSDNPAYRYRFLEPTSQFLARPVLDTHGWDHDCGYDGVNVEHSLAVANRFPAAVAVQLTKDKKEFSLHLDSSVSAKHGENGSSMIGFDIQNVGKQLAYIFRGDTKFKNFKMNKTAAGVSVTFLGQNVASGFKLEDQIALGKRLMLVGSTGTVLSQGDAAYGANLEVRLREADYPIGQDQSSLGLSLVKWRGELALGANLQSQISIGRSSKVAVRAGLNNKMSGQITVRTSSSEQLQIALVSLLPIAMSIYKSIRPGVGQNYSMY